ncbi:MAG TPA: tetratricopeptide repeat protein [Desulfomonilaceae bacterium]|nr:tetratricopeptide repeat protein [Desulfomonilaceae bacterium]
MVFRRRKDNEKPGRNLVDKYGMTFNFLKIVAVLVLIVAQGTLFCVPCLGSDANGDGIRAALAGKFDRAIACWTSAIGKNPKSYVAHVNRGSAYMRTGYVLKGITDWHRARELSPPFAYALYTGDFIAQNADDSPLLNYVVSLELEPDHISSVVMIGTAYQDIGQTEQAAELYRKSMDLTKNPLLKSSLDHWITTITSGSQD